MIRQEILTPFCAKGAYGIFFNIREGSRGDLEVIDPGPWMPVLKVLADDLNAVYPELRYVSEMHSMKTFEACKKEYGRFRLHMDPLHVANLLYVKTCDHVEDGERPIVDISNLVGFSYQMRLVFSSILAALPDKS